MEEANHPGPGKYEHTGDVAASFQPVSTYKTIEARTFGSELRPEWTTRFQSPGPGAYVPPSDFGYLTLSPRNAVETSTKAQSIYKAKVRIPFRSRNEKSVKDAGLHSVQDSKTPSMGATPEASDNQGKQTANSAMESRYNMYIDRKVS